MERLREHGYCKLLYIKRRDPIVKIKVVDTNMIADASKHLEILVRLIYSIFAKEPDKFAIVSPAYLFKYAVQYGYMGKDLMHERLLSPAICSALRNNAIVIYIYNFIYICADDVFLGLRHIEKNHWYY